MLGAPTVLRAHTPRVARPVQTGSPTSASQPAPLACSLRKQIRERDVTTGTPDSAPARSPGPRGAPSQVQPGRPRPGPAPFPAPRPSPALRALAPRGGPAPSLPFPPSPDEPSSGSFSAPWAPPSSPPSPRRAVLPAPLSAAPARFLPASPPHSRNAPARPPHPPASPGGRGASPARG